MALSCSIQFTFHSPWPPSLSTIIYVHLPDHLSAFLPRIPAYQTPFSRNTSAYRPVATSQQSYNTQHLLLIEDCRIRKGSIVFNLPKHIYPTPVPGPSITFNPPSPISVRHWLYLVPSVCPSSLHGSSIWLFVLILPIPSIPTQTTSVFVPESH